MFILFKKAKVVILGQLILATDAGQSPSSSFLSIHNANSPSLTRNAGAKAIKPSAMV